MLSLLVKAEHTLSARFAEWRRRQQAYAELAALDDRSLADIGITRSEIPYVLAPKKARKLGPTAAPRSLKHAA